MSMFAWVMMGLAIWHFTIWVPDRFWGGIVGAFVFSIVGSVLFGLIINGFAIPGSSDTTIVSAVEAIPGALIALGLCYLIGIRKGNEPAVA
jgi:hypothetical protein